MTGCRRAIGIGLGAMLLAAAGCGRAVEKPAEGTTATKAVPVTVTPLRRLPVERTVEIVGTLKGWEEVTVGSKKAGRVLKVYHDMGDRVKPGEPLVELDPVDAQLALLQAESRYLAALAKLDIKREEAEKFLAKYGVNEKLYRGEEADRVILQTPAVVQAFVTLEKAQQNLARQRQITQRGAGTVQELQNMENDYKAAEAAKDNAILTARTLIAEALTSRVAYDVAKQALEDMTIRAPQPKTLPEDHDRPLHYAVTRKVAVEGQMLKEGEAVADLVIEDPLKLWSNVPERFSSEVEVGQAVKLAVASQPGKDFKGHVTRINPAVDPVSRTFQVEALVENDEGLLRPGGFAKASIVTRHDDEAVIVPIESVVRFAGVTKIFLVEGKVAHSVNVNTGIEGRGWIEITGNLPSQGQVVTTGQTQLADGTPVIVREPEPEKTAPASTSPAPAAQAGL
ncbi:MAG: efflux RND transporter periplasmic adaptor subunit [Isosphaeraceae bacterium]|nr:efflux RND transporter periplasmic adaptor subunit [Isosphaeraceae bacterium]